MEVVAEENPGGRSAWLRSMLDASEDVLASMGTGVAIEGGAGMGCNMCGPSGGVNRVSSTPGSAVGTCWACTIDTPDDGGWAICWGTASGVALDTLERMRNLILQSIMLWSSMMTHSSKSLS